MTTTILICADEEKNRGERDYAIALALELAEKNDIQATSYKVSRTDNTTTGQGADVVDLASNNNDYEKIAAFDLDDVLDRIKSVDGDVKIIGAGQSTYPELMQVADASKGSNHCEFGFITHIVSEEQEQALAETNIKVFAPLNEESVPKLHAAGNLVEINSVPHRATSESLAYNARTMLENAHNGLGINNVVNSKSPFCVVVLNAGFEVDGKHVPYKAEEAYSHAYALGQYMDDNTALIIVDGGPRNKADIKAGQPTGESFRQGYRRGQLERSMDNIPTIIYEQFEKGLPYNALDGMLHFARNDNCVGVISNAEGYGTMDAVIQFIDNKDKLCGMFPFEANEHVKQRMDNIAAYNKNGIACLHSNQGQLVINRHPDEVATPRKKDNPVPSILDKMNVAAPVGSQQTAAIKATQSVLKDRPKYW